MLLSINTMGGADGGGPGGRGTHYFCPRAIFVCASDMHRRNCVRIANCNSLEAPKVTTTTSLLAVWCPACDLLMLLMLLMFLLLLLLHCCRCCRQTEFSSFHYVHSGLRIASKHFSIERRRQQNTRTSESSNQIRGWQRRERGRCVGGEEGSKMKKDALGYGLFGARSHRKCLFRNSLVFLLSFYLIYSEIRFFCFISFHFVVVVVVVALLYF